MERHGPSSVVVSNTIWLIAAAIFFFVPVYFLVFGRHEPFQPNWFTSKHERARYVVIAKRMIAWFVSAGVVGAAWSVALNHLFG